MDSSRHRSGLGRWHTVAAALLMSLALPSCQPGMPPTAVMPDDTVQPATETDMDASTPPEPKWYEVPWETLPYSDLYCFQLEGGEVCDGWDNDCDGAIDEDDSSCHCGALGAPCAAGFSCSDGICVDAARERVYVPGGTYMRGAISDEEKTGEPGYAPAGVCHDFATPMHAVHVAPYAIDVFPVTVERYRACVLRGECAEPAPPFSEKSRRTYSDAKRFARYPVNNIKWHWARNFCEKDGGRLCTATEWEKAARGGCRLDCPVGDIACCRLAARIFPWGEHCPRLEDACVDTECSIPPADPCSFVKQDGTLWDLHPVGLHPMGASTYGAQDLLWLIAEWVEDCYGGNIPRPGLYFYDESFALDGSAWTPPGGCATIQTRGGDHAHCVTSPFPRPPSSTYRYIGMRCCYDLETGP